MPPVGPLRKDDGPACRVCACTQHNACLQGSGALTCSWVKTDPTDAPNHLCSACSGTHDDAEEALARVTGLLMKPNVRKRIVRQVVLSLRGRLLERKKLLMRS